MVPKKDHSRRFLSTITTHLALTAVILLPDLGLANDWAISQRIDALVAQDYRKHRIKPNPPASDEVFLRRVYLDIVGRIPTYGESQHFLDDTSRGKRRQLTRHLLNSEGYVSHWFNYWADILRVKSNIGGAAGATGEAYADWVKDALRENKSYRDLVYELITAEGYIWDNGAVGYYMRDAGMPLDNMSNTAQIFLGTQLVCAQCHNHPFDNWKQKQYYEMAAYTYGMETRVEAEKVLRLDEKMDKLEKRAKGRDGRMGMARQIRSVLGDLFEPLSYRVQHDEEKILRLPHDYQYSDGRPKEEVRADTIFGKRVSGRSRAKLASYATWLTGPDNPRFTKVIVNRLWKRVMGVGLVEPVDDFRDDTEASMPALLAYLEAQMRAVNYDMKRFLSLLYNTKTYQRESTRGDVNLNDYHFPGPTLRRMTGEQIWDSLLAVAMPGVDERKASSKYRRRYREMKARAQGLEAMKKQPGKILNVAKAIAEIEYASDEGAKAQRRRIAAARKANDDSRAQRLDEELKASIWEREKKVKEIRDAFESEFLDPSVKGSAKMMMEESRDKKDGKKLEGGPDPRWKDFEWHYVRASELRAPAPAGHFLRQFGQSDRETIQAAHSEASVGQVLILLNGGIYDELVSSKSQLMKGIRQLYGEDEKQDFIFMSLLTRLPSERERSLMEPQFAAADSPEAACKAIVWSLLNTQELLFIQ